MSSALVEFLYPKPAKRTVGSIFKWWEKRRLAYNVIVGAAGVTGFAGAFLIGLVPPVSTLFLPPLGAIAVVGVLANVFYFLGPTVETVVEKFLGPDVLPTGPALYRMGLTFSVGLGLMPILIAMIVWVARVVGILF